MVCDLTHLGLRHKTIDATTRQRKARRNIKPWCILGDFNSEEVRRCKGKDDLEQVNEIVCALINLLRKWNWKMFLRWVEDSHGVNLTTNQKVD